ncbi:MAG: hypothetical protein ACYCWE_15980 [Eubacteriales bacterium]
MEYFIGALILIFIAVIVVFFKKDIVKAFKKAAYLKRFITKKAAEYKDSELEELSGQKPEKVHTACEYDMDILAKKIAKAWWKEYNKRMWIKVIFVILLLIIGVNAVDSYLESVLNQLKGLLNVFPK